MSFWHDLATERDHRSLRTRHGVDAFSVGADLTQRAAIETMMSDLLGRPWDRHPGDNAVVPEPRAGRAISARAMGRGAGRQSVGAVPPDPPRLPAMKQRGWGRIINMASIYSTRAGRDRIDYVTTKTGIVGLTRAVALETATKPEYVHALLPGYAADAGHSGQDRKRRRA